MKIKKSINSSFCCMLINLAWVYLAYAMCRFTYLFENWSTFSQGMTWSSLAEILRGGWMFDTSAILYTNLLYFLLMLLPTHYKEHDVWQKAARWVFVICNGICIAINLADSVYFQYTGRRTTASVFSEFSNEGNLGRIFGLELVNHWYLVLLGILMIGMLWNLYAIPYGEKPKMLQSPVKRSAVLRYYVMQVLMLAAFVPLCVCGMRGGATTAVRPITISNANQYVDCPSDAALVLNTPFALIRTFNKEAFVVPEYMSTEEMHATYSPVHGVADTSPARENMGKNVVILIVESLGREYIGALNESLEDGNYAGYTPFLDSLIQHSVTFKYSYGNGRKSIDGMPSVLSAIPMFVEPFFLTPASMNDVSGVAGELSKMGYYSAFFHGAENGSMGFQAFARSTGFKDYFGRTEYDADSRFDGNADFDGTWAIWDEPFMQFFALKMGEFSQPFVSAIFTASSHHPFVIPTEYQDVFTDKGLAMHKCVRYADHALCRFFDTAKKQPWYENTLFVITADHTNMSDHAYYQTDFGVFSVPIIFYEPSGDMEPGIREGVAQQTDIMPTVLNYIGYDREYVAFGCDLFSTAPDSTWAVNYQNGIYQYVRGDYMLRFDGESSKAIYAFKTDSLLQENLLLQTASNDCLRNEQQKMEKDLKAIIQQYMQRMTNDGLIAR